MGEASEASVGRLAAGLRSLRSEGVFCDVALSAGAERCLAHRVVLAALSRPLRELLTGGEESESGRPLELKLWNLAITESTVTTLLGRVYGDDGDGSDDGSDNLSDVAQLMTAFELGNTSEAELAVGLQTLQSQGLFCDILVSAGGERIPAHQAVLASACDALKSFMMESLKQLEPGSDEGEVASRSLELELQGVSGEAVRVLLDFLYCRTLPSGDSGVKRFRKLSASEACLRDVRHLASELQLPGLEAQALLWMRSCSSPGLKLKGGCQGRKALLPAEQEDGLCEAQEEPQAAKPSKPSKPVVQRQEEEAPKLPEKKAPMQTLKFNSGCQVPMALADAMESAQATGELSRSDITVLGKLIQLFWERPVWLEAVLVHAMPSVHSDKLKSLLPFVAYQWRDGPWQQAYARLSWDPRQNSEEAKELQVIDFRDPKLKDQGKVEAKSRQEVFFKKAPALRSQLYQMTDIEDDFVKALVGGCEISAECDRRCGFLTQVVMDSVCDRLTIKSQQLREKAARQYSKHEKLPANKRARVGGS
ncbi:unnamed protein product [Polarella glacialis]|uniref:BTB domain-containing protein n=1 Tax=Polarella glacialis TaxID=89957 RepID=A0A813HEY7_POLGL|nr:unnamed protein product [Polarella glacialis]